MASSAMRPGFLLAIACCLFSSAHLSPVDSPGPVFIGDTPEDGSCISVPFGTTWITKIQVHSDTSIADIITTLLPGVQRSAILLTDVLNQWSMSVTWAPTTSEAGPATSVFCFHAIDVNGVESEQRCITLIDNVYAKGPNIIQIARTLDGDDDGKNAWDVYVDEEISKPLTSKYIYIEDAEGKVMDKINVLSHDVKISGRKLEIYTDFSWNSETKYTMVFEQGVITGNNSCHVESTSKFEPLDRCCSQKDIDSVREERHTTRQKRNTPPGLQTIVDNSANEFFIAFYRNYYLYSASLQLFINTPEPYPVSFMVTASGYSYSGVARNTSSVIVTVPSTLEVQSSSDRNKGIYVKASGTNRLSVYGSSLERYTSDSFLALPCLDQSLDEYEYYAMCYYGLSGSPCALLFVACQDNTRITTPYGSVTLNRLQTYLFERNGDTTGARITSTKPVSFFSSNRCSFVPSHIRACDYLTEQLPPTSTWGREFLVASLNGRSSPELYRIVASRSSTVFTVTCNINSQTSSYTLANAGSWREVILADNSYCSIESNHPVLVAQFAYGATADGASADPFMVMIPPIDQFSNRYVFNVLSTFGRNHINVYVAPEYYQLNRIYLDGQPIGGSWNTVSCSDGTVCGYISVRSLTAGSHILFHDDLYARIGLIVYGFDSYDSYGYPGGMILDAISASCYNGDARLVSRTGYDFEGRVEVCTNGEWGTVCDDFWGTADARVICRQLNITTTGLTAYSGGTYGQGIGPINLDDVACTGTELSLTSCPYDQNTADCTHADDAGVRCHSLPVIISYGAFYSGVVNHGDYYYLLISSWTSSGVTLSLFLSSGSCVLYASDTFQSPSTLGGYVWRITSSGYSEIFLNPATLGRQAGSYVAISLQGNAQPNSNFIIQADSGNTLTTALNLGVTRSNTVTSGQSVYYNFPYPSEGITVTITVTSGTVVCYASLVNRRPHASNHTWTVQVASRTVDLFLDPATVSSIPRSRVFVSVRGIGSTNAFSLTSIASFPSIELTIGSLVRGGLQQSRSVIYFVPFPSNGLTIRVEAITGTIRCYASDTSRRPDSLDYVWTLLITEYDDAFIDPSTLGRTPGSTLYITLEGTATTNNYTLNTTYGDTSIINLALGSPVSLSIAGGTTKYYSVPFSSGGITLRLDVSVGYITCYASDTFRNPGPGNYVWVINTRGYADGFIDPTQFGRSGTRYIYIALVGGDPQNTYLLNSTAGNFSSQELSIGDPVSDSIGSGQFRFYIFPFPSGGATVRVEVFRGGVWCYASDTNRNPSSRDYIWRLYISEYDDSFVDPTTLGRTVGSFLFIAIEGTASSNSFTLNTTTGDTSIANYGLNVGITATIASSVTKYYSIPFSSGGITLRLDVSVGYITCYASDTFRNPGPGDYVWLINTRGYADGFIDPTQFGRSGTRYIYIALVGVNSVNTYLLNSTSGNYSSRELSIGDPVSDSIVTGQFRFYIFPFPSSGVTVRVEVFRGGVWCYASDTNRNPSSRDYIWRLYISEYNDSFIDPTTLGRAAGSFLFIAIEATGVSNDFMLNSTMADTSIAFFGLDVGITATIASSVTKYYSIPFSSGGITLRLDVSVGYITCYASDTFRNPGPGDYVWLINTRGYADGFIDPTQFGRSGTRYIYVALVGVNSVNTYLLNSTTGNFSSRELSIGDPVSDTIVSGQFRFYIFPFLTVGVTVRVEVFRGGVWCYASDTNRNPSSRDYIWRLYISEYNDSFIDPTTLGRAAGSFLFIAIEATGVSNDFMLNSTMADTSIAFFGLDVGITATIASSVTKYYSVPFSSGGITLRLDVSVGYITCYASDTFRNPGSGNYVWLINTRGYADGFIDPAQFGRLGTRYIYVALVGGSQLNTYLLNSTSGNFSSQEVAIGDPVYDTISSGQFRFYIFPFLTGGVTVRVEVFRGGVWCYASDTNRNPSSRDYIWRLYISGYNDSFIDPTLLGRTAGSFLFIAIEGISTTNDFTLNSTTGNTSIKDVSIGAVISDTISDRVIKFYSLPFPANGLTLNLSVSSGYVNCYVSDRFRNPNEYMYDWFIDVRNYWEVYIDPRLLSRTPGSFLYVSLQGVDTVNVYKAESFLDNTLTIEPQPPFDLQANSVSPTRATITWTTPPPNRVTPWAVVYNYEIILSEYAFGLPNVNENSTTETFTFYDLEEFNNYSVIVAAENQVGLGNFSIILNFSTPQAAPTGPPLNPSGMQVTTTLITLSWSPPELIHVNGIIDHYRIRVLEVYTGRVFSLLSSDESILVGPLHPFYVYSCQIAAYTVGLGPYGPPFTVQAGETVPTAPPQNVSYGGRTNVSITLTWNPPPFNHQNGLIRSYSINFTDPGSGLQRLFKTNSSDTSFTVGSLLPFSSYIFSIAAETISLGPYSPSINVSTVEGVPKKAPDNVAISAPNATTIFLTWSGVTTSVGIIRDYIIRLTEVDTGRMLDYRTSLTSIAISVHPDYTYRCSVSAFTIAAGPFSTPVTIRTPEDAPSGSPQNISALATSSRTLLLSWDPPELPSQNGEIISYTVNISVVESEENFQYTSTSTELELSSLRPYHTYLYIIAASTAAGEGPFSMEVAIRLPEDVPSAPTSVEVDTVAGQPSQLLVAWQLPETPNGLITTYKVFCFESEDSPSEDGSGTKQDTPPEYRDSISNATVFASEMSAVMEGLDPYMRYGCIVVAYTTIGEGEPSSLESGVTAQSTPGGPPNDFTLDDLDSSSMSFTWSQPTIPNGVIVSYTITYNLTGLPVSVVIVNTTQYRITGLNAYTVYQITLFASTIVGAGPSTAPQIHRTDIAIPTAPPRNFTASVTGTTSAEFNWQPPLLDDHNGLLSYYQLRLVDESFNLTEITINTTNTSYSISTLEEYIRYSCQVAAATDIGIGPYTAPILITTLQNVPSAPPELLTGSVESSTLILLSWDPPPPYDRNGEIIYYLIHMMEQETGRFWTLPVFNAKTSAYVGSLHPYYHYECSVATYTIALGPYSESIILLTEEEAPSSPPMTVLPQLVTTTSLSLTWQPPSFENTNGVIQQYIILLEEVNTGRILTATSNTTDITVEDLHPFYTYICRVAAETVEVGPYSAPINVQLNEDVPTAPPTLTSYYAVDPTTLFLSWSAPPLDQQNGIIRRYDISLLEIETGFIFSYTATNTNYTIAGLHPDYQYQIDVSAVTIGTGPSSLQVLLQMPEDAPSAPPDEVGATEIFSESVYLSWRAPLRVHHNGDIIGYNVTYSALNSDTVDSVFSTYNDTVLTYLIPFTTYTVAVAAVTSAGTGPYSSPISFMTDEAAPSSPPEQLNGTAVSSSSIYLTWSPPPVFSQNGVIREYQINLTEVDTGREIVLYSTMPSLTVTSLHPFYTYLCRVSAFTVEYSPFSDGFQIATPEDAPSGFPQDVSVGSTTSRTVELSWNLPLREERNGIITGYVITISRYGTDSQYTLTSINNSISLGSLSPYTTYTASVAATTSVGVGPPSTQLSFTTAEDVPDSAPRNPFGTVIDSRTLSFTWDPPLEEDRNGITRQYRINVVEVDTGRQFQVVATTTSISVSSLHPYYTYQWAVSAFTIGAGPYSTSQTISTPEDAPSGAPQMLTVTETEVTNISLTWQLPPLDERNGVILGFIVRLSSVSLRTETREITTIYTNITVTSLTPYTVYECVVSAYTSVGTGPPSSFILARTEPTNPSGTPSNTTGVALNSTHIHIDWDPPPPEQHHGELTEYRITIRELETSTILNVSSDPDVTEAIVGPLHPYYIYNCTILAVTVGEGPPSTVVTVRTEEHVPSGPPTRFSLSLLSSTSVQLLWEPPLPEERNGIIRQYIIYVELAIGEILSYTTGSTNYSVSGLTPFTTYSFSVAAVTIGTGPTTDRRFIQTSTAPPGGPPQLVRAQSISPTSLLITWEPPLQELRNGIIQQYTVVITELESEIVTTLYTEATRLNVTSLHPYYTYNCTVAAETISVGPFSSPVLIQLPESAPSSPPSDISYGLITSTSFTLSWTPPPPDQHNGVIRHYNVSCTELKTGTLFRRLTINSTTESVVDSLHPFYNYTCAVAAVTVDSGPFSSNITVSTAQDVPSAAPVGLTIVSQLSTSITLSWSLPPEEARNGVITGYSVNATNTATGQVLLLPTTSDSISVASLSPYTMYHCSIAARTAVGLGPYTQPLLVLTDEETPVAAPVSLMIGSTTSTSTTLSWRSPPQHLLNGVLRHYMVNVQEVDTGRNNSLTSIETEVVLSGLHPFYTYNFAVCAVTVDTGPCAYFEPIQLPEDVPSGSPLNINATTPSPTSVLLLWNSPPRHQQNGIITTYYVNVTEVETGASSQWAVTDAMQLLIDTFHPYYVYTFIISAATSVGQGPYSPVLTIQTPEDVPSSPPLNSSGEVLSSSTLSITWLPPAPEGQNGIITSYTVRLIERPTNTTLTYKRSGLHTEVFITNLHPYYEYSCSVTAETSVGLGPFSVPFLLTTHQDAPSSPPQNVQSVHVNSTSVRLTWQAPESSGQNGIIQQYFVSVTEVDTMRQFQLTFTSTFATVLDLHPYYTYLFTVSAVTIEEGPSSVEISVQTLEDAPSGPPQSFQAVAISSTSVRLTWAAPLPEEQNGVIVSYRITVTDVESGEVVQQTSTSASLLIVDSINSYHTYRCAVAATTVATGPETYVEVTTFQEAPTGSPQNATVTLLDPSRVECSWLPPSAEDVNGVVIGFVSRVTGQDSNEMIEQQTNATNILVENLHPFYSYVFTVAALTAAGLGPFSPVVDFQMLTSAPEGFINHLTAVIDSSTSVTLSWLPLEPGQWNGVIVSYTVEYQRQEQVEFVGNPKDPYITSTASIPSLPEHPLANSPDPRLVSLPLRAESLQLEGLEENYIYQFTVYFENSVGRSERSRPLQINMPPSIPSGPPVNITVVSDSSTEFFISWQPPEHLEQNGIIIGYIIQIRPSNDLSLVRVHNVTADINSLRVTGLEKFTDFQVSVAAGTSLGYGPFSTPASIKTLEDVPSIPLDLSVRVTSSSSVEVSWSTPLATNGIIIDYELCYGKKSGDEKATTNDFCQNIIENDEQKHVKDISNLDAGLTYEFRVRARTSVGYGPYTTAEEAKLSLAVVSEPGALNNRSGSTVAAASVLAVFGWIILIIVVVATVVFVVWFRRRQRIKKLNLEIHDVTDRTLARKLRATNRVYLEEFDNMQVQPLEEDSVIANTQVISEDGDVDSCRKVDLGAEDDAEHHVTHL